MLPNPEDCVCADVTGVDPSFPNPREDDETPAVVATELGKDDDSCKGFGTLYLLDNF